jgi:hypothetical protein
VEVARTLHTFVTSTGEKLDSHTSFQFLLHITHAHGTRPQQAGDLPLIEIQIIKQSR